MAERSDKPLAQRTGQSPAGQEADRNAPDAYIQMDELSVGYGGKAIIRDICLDIRRGEIVTLIGPNGAGKSTILKSITRQLALVGGKVIFDGQNLGSLSYRDLSKKMAVVLTERLKTDLLTCYDIVASGRYPYTGKLGILTEEDERKVDEAMAAVHAADLGPRDFNAISDGQRQRILLARAICQDPEIIVLDEPTSFLDIRYKLELLSILRRMAKEKGITVVMSLHEIDLAQKISDRIICVKGEQIYRYGAPEEIFSEAMIRELYSLDNGFFDPVFGSIELPAPTGMGCHSGEHDANGCEAGGGGASGLTAEPAGPREQPVGPREHLGAPEESSAGAPGRCPDQVPMPRAFVLSSGGSGIPVFRMLQKQDIPFAAGILSPNDIDYQLARLLAAEVVTTPAFEPIGEPAFGRAQELVETCQTVYLTEFPIGSMNRRIEQLVQQAKELGKLQILRSGQVPANVTFPPGEALPTPRHPFPAF